MEQLNLQDVIKYIESNIGVFHEKRIKSLDTLKLPQVLKRENPYLFKAKYALTSEQIIRGIVDAHILSNEEAIFDDWLKSLVIFINQKIYNGWKSGIPNIDFEFDKDGTRYIVIVKSSPNWENSSQISKMIADFKTAKKILLNSNSQLNVVFVNGCCYGRDNNPDKGDYFKYCGQEFWTFISGNENLYLEIIKLLHKAHERNDEFQKSYSQMINKFTKQFADEFFKHDGEIDWEKLVRFNSGSVSK